MPYEHWMIPQVQLVPFLNEKEKEGVYEIVTVCPTAGALYSIIGRTYRKQLKAAGKRKHDEEIESAD